MTFGAFPFTLASSASNLGERVDSVFIGLTLFAGVIVFILAVLVLTFVACTTAKRGSAECSR